MAIYRVCDLVPINGPLVEEFLAERGLSLSREKARITHINDGFDFRNEYPRV
ncbi:hypothetical protein [Paraburkholderia heleia]|uniref:hypothetical protein n=1 Tax=Paraburkholderia heleia TaxID=634127 RepID=UPI000A44C0A6|nr:hypothetical protein [Paraburkholderia heleia]